MTAKVVTTQAELDSAIQYAKDRPAEWVDVEIRSERGVWLELRETPRRCTVTARESSTVTARGSSTVTARESSTVTAWESSTVTAWGSSTVTAWESSTVTARGSSTVTAGAYVAVHLHSGRADASATRYAARRSAA